MKKIYLLLFLIIINNYCLKSGWNLDNTQGKPEVKTTIKNLETANQTEQFLGMNPNLITPEIKQFHRTYQTFSVKIENNLDYPIEINSENYLEKLNNFISTEAKQQYPKYGRNEYLLWTKIIASSPIFIFSTCAIFGITTFIALNNNISLEFTAEDFATKGLPIFLTLIFFKIVNHFAYEFYQKNRLYHTERKQAYKKFSGYTKGQIYCIAPNTNSYSLIFVERNNLLDFYDILEKIDIESQTTHAQLHYVATRDRRATTAEVFGSNADVVTRKRRTTDESLFPETITNTETRKRSLSLGNNTANPRNSLTLLVPNYNNQAKESPV